MTAHRSSPRARLGRATALAAAGLLAAAVLVACGDADSDAGHSGGHGQGGSPGPSAETDPADRSDAEWNDADVAFARGMIPHHRQAVEMAGLAATRAESPEVSALAEQIEAAQAPEIATLTEWLTAWGEDVPAEDETEDGGHSEHDMPGMMASEDLAILEQSEGPEFDAAFLRMMIEHHEGAVAMAETERADGAHRPALDLAAEIIATQSDEITRMNDLIDVASAG
ncbi:DUF305 domain-containing protein [Streptomyces hainanensis]|uniref:DUF305 domain-containing protein n=1 Tax=Streptomyces hainanensis TaxID=402648 RepID=A0A4R4TJF2_9ACTN|nr:DUF305 domain-containing protein [Streptomyces hainanensis]TDC75894.1 DUF305 domain-containing protein [Streptomyces hainanensis]